MGLFFFIALFSLFVNNEYNVYEEGFLLGFYFVLFFLVVYANFKSMFKLVYVLSILRKYAIFLTLFRVNLSCNSLLKSFVLITKLFFKRLIERLKFYKYVINFILVNIFSKYYVLIFLLFLYFSINVSCIKDATSISGGFLLNFVKMVNAISFNDYRLYI